MSGSRASSEVLTSPSPSPPPSAPLNGKGSASKAKAAALDDTSSLSELTDDEGDGSRGVSTHSTTPEEASGTSKRKRGSLVPAPMWGWAYKAAGRKPTDNTKEPGKEGSSTPPPPPSITTPLQPNGTSNDEIKQRAHTNEPAQLPCLDEADKGGESDASAEGGPDADGLDDDEEEEEEEEEEEPEEEQPDSEEEDPVIRTDVPSKNDEKTRVPSPDLTDAEEEDGVLSERESESGSDVESEEEAISEKPAQKEPICEPPLKVTIDSAVPVVSIAPAGSSIMAGQQLIKTPTPSPSTSPEPEEQRLGLDELNIKEPKPEVIAELQVEPEVDPEVDIAENENVEQVEIEADIEPEVGVEVEEAEMDFQPAHRAEALDILAAIELKYALLREELYIEKMEDLAKEEAMILQGIHAEMIQLQEELQCRHDRRLDLAAKKRKHEDDHVKMMRKYDEDAIREWWKHERDQLQWDMFAEANRKRRKLDREKKLAERPPEVRHIPPPPPFTIDPSSLTVRELFRASSAGSQQHLTARQRHRQSHRSTKPRSYPTLSVLTLPEVQHDLQQLPTRRPLGFGSQFGTEIGPGMGVVVPSAHEPFPDNALGIIPGQQVFGQGPPPFPPPPTTQHRSYPSSTNRSTPNQSHHHVPIGAPPIGGLHHGGPRPMQGTGQPLVQNVTNGPPPIPGYNPPRQLRRSPSPLPFDMNGVNGSLAQHSMSGPGQRGWSGAGPSKPNGWNKDSRRVSGSSSKEVHQFDMRDMREERDFRSERERRGRERDEWYDNGGTRDGDEHARPYGPSTHLPAGAHPHRHTLQHQNLQGIPHHHHVVHRHPTHHHHDLSRTGVPGRLPGAEYDHRDHRSRRLPPDADHHVNQRPNASPMWKSEDMESSRDRGRPPTLMGPSSSAMGSLGPPPPSDRLQPTPFVMTPSQAMQGYPPQPGPRRDHWDDGRPPPYVDGHVPHTLDPGPSRHGHPPHRLSSPPLQGSRNGLTSPRRIGLPASPPFQPLNQAHSPRHHSLSSHPSPRMGAASLKSTRPISPLPAKMMTSGPALYPPGPTGPGTPGLGGSSSRIGTPGLAGPGTRPDVPPHPNGHGSLSLFPSPAPPPPLTGPGGQSHLPPSNSDLLPSKMSVIPLGP